MGNEYSRIKGRAFPASSFLVGFRQPDIVQVVHAPAEIGKLVRLTVLNYWTPGIRSEKKFTLGFELRLEKEPFDSEVQPIDRLLSVYKLINQLMAAIMDAGCSLVTSGIFLQGACRSSWVFNAVDERRFASASPAGVGANLLTVAFEDWGRLMTVNAPEEVNSELVAQVGDIWPKGSAVAISQPRCFALELRDQPWDSYKEEGERGPLIVLALVRILATNGYEFLAATHARGNMSCLTFVKTLENRNTDEAQLMAVSLNQRDQIRLYDAPGDIFSKAVLVCRQHWAPGCLRTEATEAGVAGRMHRIQLKSSPWFVQAWDRNKSVSACELVMELIKEICSMGWTIVLNADIYRSAYDKSLLVLRRTSQALVQPHLSVAIQESSHLLVLGAAEELKEKLTNEIRDAWFRSQQCEISECGSGWVIGFNFSDQPWEWHPDNPDVTIEGLGLVAALLDALISKGWRLVANIDVTSGSKFSPTTWIMQLQIEEIRQLTFR